MKPQLDIDNLCSEAALFAHQESSVDEPTLYGKADGKSLGTYLQQKFTAHLAKSYSCEIGNSASGIDLPGLDVDIKVTSLKQPQSSCPYRDATQKIFGLGYHLLIFVYEKYENHKRKTVRLDIRHVLFVDRKRTADFQTTKGLTDILNRDGNKDDIMAFLLERNLPVDDIGLNQISDRVLETPPIQGYLTVSNALQWRLQYRRVIQKAGEVSGVVKVR